MERNDMIVCTFVGDTQIPKTNFVAKILDIDITNNSFDCEFVISQQRMRFQTNTSGIWSGVDVTDNTYYEVDTHDIYTPYQSGAAAEQAATITFGDGAMYLCYVESINETINIQFYHAPYLRMRLSQENQIAFTEWDQYPEGEVIVSIDASYLVDNITTPKHELTPDTSADWPPKPDYIKQYGTKERENKFGKFRFIPEPTENGGDGIRILDNWSDDNIINVPIPQLAKYNIVNGSLNPPTRYSESKSFIKFNKNGAEQLQKLWQDWEDAGLLDRIHTFDGGFVARYVRNTQNRNPRPLSNHSWGTAFDINYEWNKLSKVPALMGQKGCVRELVALANKNGFYWGGHFGESRIDGMHFELGEMI